MRVSTLRAWIGIEMNEVSWKEKVVSVVGGMVAILAVIGISRDLVGGSGANVLIGSMGASAVLLLAVPHGALSQPWPALAGHLVSATIGVTAAEVFGPTAFAGALAVGLSIGAMHQFRFIHPPGGATALAAVLGGPAVRDLGYSFVWRPVMLNALTIVVIAVLFNALFPWRRYPAQLVRRRRVDAATPAPAPGPSHDAVVAALRQLDSFVDITEDDLVRLVQILSARTA